MDLTTHLTTHQETILVQTNTWLNRCKATLAALPPASFLGAGVQFITLAARQVFWQSIRTGDNSLGWSNIENLGWLLKHKRDVNRFFEYCQCVEDLAEKGAPIDIINQQCTTYDPEVQMGSAFILSEGVRKLYQWLAHE